MDNRTHWRRPAARAIAHYLARQQGEARGQLSPPLVLLAGPQPMSPRWRDAILIVAAIAIGATVAFWLCVGAGAP